MAGDSSAIALLAGENVVMSSDEDTLVLTNVRIRLDVKAAGNSRLVTMVLDSVASCGLVTQSRPLLLLLAALAGLGGISQQGSIQRALFAAAVLLVLAYFSTRRTVLTVTSSGGSEIVVPARGMGRSQIVKFIDAVDREKLSFLSKRLSSVSVVGGGVA